MGMTSCTIIRLLRGNLGFVLGFFFFSFWKADQKTGKVVYFGVRAKTGLNKGAWYWTCNVVLERPVMRKLWSECSQP